MLSNHNTQRENNILRATQQHHYKMLHFLLAPTSVQIKKKKQTGRERGKTHSEPTHNINYCFVELFHPPKMWA